jgi:predicted Rossmann fold nucleotide-binding protein DprA/Smf involved in DNA uptake
MNFAQMLAMDVKPLPDTRAPRETNKLWRDPTVMHEARHRNGVKKYCAAIGHEWLKTVEVAERLNMARMSIYKQLVKYVALGILEQRPVDKPYNHHTGWEWRVK